MAILQNGSSLSKSEFNQFFIEDLLKNGRLGEKALESSSYQRIFRHTVGSNTELTKQKSGLPSLVNGSLPMTYGNYLFKKNIQ